MADMTGDAFTTRAERIESERAGKRSFVLPFVLGGASALALAGGGLALFGAFSGGGSAADGVSLAAGVCIPDGGIGGGTDGTGIGGGLGGGLLGGGNGGTGGTGGTGGDGGTTPGGGDGGTNPGGDNPGGGTSVNPLDLITLNGQGGPLLWLNLTGTAPGVLGSRTGTGLDSALSGLDDQALTPVVGGTTSGLVTGGSSGGSGSGGLGGILGGLSGIGGGLGSVGGGSGTGSGSGGSGSGTGGSGSAGSNIVDLSTSGSPVSLNLSGSATGVLGTGTTPLDGTVSSVDDQVLTPVVGALTDGLLR